MRQHVCLERLAATASEEARFTAAADILLMHIARAEVQAISKGEETCKTVMKDIGTSRTFGCKE
jgi:hypothetical protein